MFRPTAKITIGANVFDFVTEGFFMSSWKMLTDTGELVLPHKFKKDKKVVFIGEDNFFKKGEKVTVEAGYFPNKETLFTGYLTSVKPSIPVTLTFEDASFLLKQTNLTLSFKKISLKELLEEALKESIAKSSGYVLEGLKEIKIEAIDAELGAFRLSNVNFTAILQELKKTYALTSFFRGSTLYVGLAYYTGDRKRHAFEFQKNIIDDGTSLEYLKEDDVAFKIKAVSILENNKKIEIEVGDPNGETRTITKYNLTEKELKAAAEREADRLRYEGFRGSLYTFLEPTVRHGDEIELIDLRQPEKNGVYLAESVEYQIGINGSFQSINLGVKVG